MATLKNLFGKKRIQFIYNIIGYCIKRDFNSIFIEENNELIKQKSIDINKFLENRQMEDFEKLLSMNLNEKDFLLYKSEPEYQDLMIIFYMSPFILNKIYKNYSEITLLKPGESFIYENIAQYMNCDKYHYFHEWFKAETSHNLVKSMYENIKKECRDILKTKTSFFSLLTKNNCDVNIDLDSAELIEKSKDFKKKFNLKSLTVYPGKCNNFSDAINEYTNQFLILCDNLGIPHSAIGASRLNLSIRLDESFNLSLINLKVDGYHFFTNIKNEYNIFIKVPFVDTIIHEYAHFLSSVIFYESKNRKNESVENIHKWNNDTKGEVNLFKNAHAMKLEWVSKNINLCKWDSFVTLNKNTPDDAGFKFLEYGLMQRITEGIANIPDEMKQSETIINLGFNKKIKEYFSLINNKMIEFGIINKETFIPHKNIVNATRFFLEESSYLFYKHEVNNDYLKGLLRLSYVDNFVIYQANPEEIWARSFEELIKIGESKKNDYISFHNKEYNASNIVEEMYKPDIHLNSADRLHILYIIKFILDDICPEHGFIPEISYPYIKFKENNKNEDPTSLKKSYEILDSGLEWVYNNKTFKKFRP